MDNSLTISLVWSSSVVSMSTLSSLSRSLFDDRAGDDGTEDRIGDRIGDRTGDRRGDRIGDRVCLGDVVGDLAYIQDLTIENIQRIFFSGLSRYVDQCVYC